MFNPYSVEKIADKFYIKVLIFNNKVWYPWSYSYIAKSGYPVKLDRLEYAKSFKTEQETEDFIISIFK